MIRKISLILSITWFLIHVIYSSFDGLSCSQSKADVALILGTKVNEDGSLSNRLQSRLNSGLELYKQHQIQQLIVSGGLGKEGYYEAEKMKQYLVNNGVPSRAIIVDNDGNNTFASTQFTKTYCEKAGFSSLIVVSQFYHLTRAKMMLRKLGLKQVESASPHYFEWRDLYSISREFVAYYWWRLKFLFA